MHQPTHWRTIEIPESFVTPDGYAGDIRMGSLRHPGTIDFLVYRSVDNAHDEGGMKPVYIGAFDIDGQPLWSVGEGGEQPSRPGPIAIHDIDGDGASEVICFFKREDLDAATSSLADIELQIRDGATGQLKRSAAPEALTTCEGHGPNWVHQRILIANLRGLDMPRDFIVKLGTVVLAFDQNLELLWRYECPWSEYGHCPAYIPSVGDLDNDGHDEVNGGYYLLDHDGTVLWENDWGPNMDSVAITAWDGGQIRAIGSGHGHVIDATGNVILALGDEHVPHGQEVRVARFTEDDPDPQMAIRWNGHHTDIILVNTSGDIVNRFQVNASPNNTGMEAVYWDGPDRPALLYNGGMLWDPATGEGTELPGLPLPDPVGRMAWYHCIPANVCGDEREDLLLYDPWNPRILVYTSGEADDAVTDTYAAGPRQYNARLMD
jgi:hypothetical protein